MSRYYKNYDKDDFDDGWCRQEGESDEDYEERMNDWNSQLESYND